KVLQENSRQLYERLEKTAQALQEVNKEVGKMSEIGRSMQELQEFLKSPKLRGNIGEQVLKDLISQVFPKNSFHLQHSFKSGEKVDAAIKTDAGILCIDSKFPMENFQRLIKSSDEERDAIRKDFGRDVKKHIETIARKYILPEEGTMDFALMYVPSEAVFYEIVNMDDIVEFAKRERVYIVSPSTLYVHLQTILLSFEGKKIESRSKEVFQLLRALQVDYIKVNESLDILGKHLGNASNQYTNVSKSFSLLGRKLSTTKQLEEKMDQEFLED
ncbi:MAG: DNA recombination protein RmuC, partial [Patescibacteria group bacterium]|nr:DNA recombination protein RmuC [Patescibacteria group bacterium]